MKINISKVHAEVEAAFRRYETALVANDVAVLDEMFHQGDHTIRYGGAENLYGYAAIRDFRAGRSSQGLQRQLSGTVITSFGQDAAVASTLFQRNGMPGVGRQTQTWIRFAEGWKVVAAHVSVIADPAAGQDRSTAPDDPGGDVTGSAVPRATG